MLCLEELWIIPLQFIQIHWTKEPSVGLLMLPRVFWQKHEKYWLWDVMLYNLVNVHWCLRGVCCLHLQGGRVLKVQTGSHVIQPGSHVIQTLQQLHNNRHWITEGAKTVCFKSERGFAIANLGIRKVVCGH